MSSVKIQSVLSSSQEIADEVAERIMLAPVDQNTKTPNISYEYEGDDPVYDMSGIANITRQDWRIFVTARTLTAAERIKGLVIMAMSTETTEFRSVLNESSYIYDGEAKLHKFDLGFRIIY